MKDTTQTIEEVLGNAIDVFAQNEMDSVLEYAEMCRTIDATGEAEFDTCGRHLIVRSGGRTWFVT